LDYLYSLRKPQMVRVWHQKFGDRHACQR